MNKDRLPPYNIEAEHAVLGCLLLDPPMTIPIVQARLTGEAFYDGRHQIIYETIIETFEKNGHLDLIILQKTLRDRKKLDAIGGMSFLAGLQNATPSAASIEHYLPIVTEAYVLRKLIQVCSGTVTKIYDGGSQKDTLTDLQKEVMEIDPNIGKAEDVSMKDLMHKVQDRIERYRCAQEETRGLLTGFYDLDAIFNGMKAGQLNILAARPSVGKSSLALNIAENVAVAGDGVGIFSMEMEAEELGERSVSGGSSIDGETIQNGSYDDAQLIIMAKIIAHRSNLPIHICDRGGMNFQYFRARLRRMVQKHKIKLAIIDYLQLFSLPGRENRSIEIGAVTTGLKALAKELRIVILCLSQLNRDLEKDNRKPRMSDLRDSGSIEQDADKILLLSEEQKQTEQTKKKTDKLFTAPEEPGDSDAVVIVGDVPKNRGGKKGTMRFLFRRQFTRFETISRIDPEDY